MHGACALKVNELNGGQKSNVSRLIQKYPGWNHVENPTWIFSRYIMASLVISKNITSYDLLFYKKWIHTSELKMNELHEKINFNLESVFQPIYLFIDGYLRS